MAIYLAKWAKMGFLPRAGGIMDQDPEELRRMDIALDVFEEKNRQEEERLSRKKE